jgi:hypothetical protein
MVPVVHRRIVAVMIVALGMAQAFDSGIRSAPTAHLIVVAAAIVLTGVVFWLSSHAGVQFAAGVACLAVVTAVRVWSPVPLPTLSLAGFFPCVAALILQAAARARSSQP